MGRKNSPSAKKELVTLITNYEEAKAENRRGVSKQYGVSK